MNRDIIHFLSSPETQTLLQGLAGDYCSSTDRVGMTNHLRRQFDREQTAALIETLELRRRASAKFSRASLMLFDRAGLEQSSAEIISAFRARRFAKAGCAHVLDLCCGIGGDALGLSSVCRVTGVDTNDTRLAMAEHNLKVYGLADKFTPVHSDVTQLDLTTLGADAFFIDPARRDETGKRTLDPEHFSPPLSWIETLRKIIPDGAVKLAPGIDHEDLPADAEIEFISVEGELREAVAWFGKLRTPARLRATVLPGEHTLIETQPRNIPATDVKACLYEPDPAVIRAHLVQELAGQLKATKIDDQIAYLTADAPTSTPFAKCYEVETVFPFNKKTLKKYLRQMNVGWVSIKRRGSPVDVGALEKFLRLEGTEHRTVFLTRIQDRHSVIIGR